MLILYAFIKHRLSVPYPLVNTPLVVQNHAYFRALLAALFMYSGQYGLVFLMGLYLQYNREFLPTEVGQIFMLQVAVMAFCAPLAGRLSDHWGARLLATLGYLIIACGQLVLTFIGDQMPIAMMTAALMLIGLGHGMFSTPNNSCALGTIPEHRMGIASALLNQAKLIGQLTGTIIVSLLLSLSIGNEVITEAHFDSLQRVTQIAIFTSLCFALLGAFFPGLNLLLTSEGRE